MKKYGQAGRTVCAPVAVDGFPHQLPGVDQVEGRYPGGLKAVVGEQLLLVATDGEETIGALAHLPGVGGEVGKGEGKREGAGCGVGEGGYGVCTYVGLPQSPMENMCPDGQEI